MNSIARKKYMTFKSSITKCGKNGIFFVPSVHGGTDIPVRRMTKMWMEVRIKIVNGIKETCIAKKRPRVSCETGLLPLINQTSQSPMTGIEPGKLVATVVAQYESWLQGRRYPERQVVSVTPNIIQPTNQC